MINYLTDMGFTLDACKRAVHQNGGASVDVALNWLFEHTTDPDINDPFTLDRDVVQSGSFTPDPVELESL